MSTNKVRVEPLRAGVIGLGIMGGAFAKHLVEAGVSTSGFDILAANLEAFRALGGHACSSARQVAAEADIVITSLPHFAALENALFGEEGVLAASHPGVIVVETSTLSLEQKESARARLAHASVAMLDAPISGTGSQAQAKDIAIFASGDRPTFDGAREILAHLARSVRYVGPFGAGSKMKYIANLLVAIHTASAAEAIVLGEKAGLDVAVLVEVLTDSAATSRMLEVRGPSMAAGDHAKPMMKVEVFQKDLEIIGAFGKNLNCPVPIFSACVPFYTAAAAQGMNLHDTAAVVSVLRRLAGLLG